MIVPTWCAGILWRLRLGHSPTKLQRSLWIHYVMESSPRRVPDTPCAIGKTLMSAFVVLSFASRKLQTLLVKLGSQSTISSRTRSQFQTENWALGAITMQRLDNQMPFCARWYWNPESSMMWMDNGLWMAVSHFVTRGSSAFFCGMMSLQNARIRRCVWTAGWHQQCVAWPQPRNALHSIVHSLLSSDPVQMTNLKYVCDCRNSTIERPECSSVARCTLVFVLKLLVPVVVCVMRQNAYRPKDGICRGYWIQHEISQQPLRLVLHSIHRNRQALSHYCERLSALYTEFRQNNRERYNANPMLQAFKCRCSSKVHKQGDNLTQETTQDCHGGPLLTKMFVPRQNLQISVRDFPPNPFTKTQDNNLSTTCRHSFMYYRKEPFRQKGDLFHASF